MTGSNITALGIFLGLGLLVGLQRERYHSRIAGIRTFTLITLFGSVSGMLAEYFQQGWIIAVGGFSVAWLLGIANFLKKSEKEPDIGQTTEIAALLMYAVGACLIVVNHLAGIVAGGVVALLLYLKQYLREIVARLGEKDLQAIMLFVAISLVILPVLPDKDFGPYEVFNLRETWLMVVLIVGLGVTGYFAYKWLGDTMGTALSGILGGLISSTATSVTYSKQTKETPSSIRLAGFVIMAASTIAFARILIEISIVAPRQFGVVAPPLVVVMVFMALVSVGLFYYNKNKGIQVNEPENPAQFKTALVFAILYAAILFVIAIVKDYYGNEGLYVVSVISGLTDMDAITLSLSNMMEDGRIDATSGGRFLLVASLSNLVFKGGMVALFGHRSLLKIIVPAFGFVLIVGILMLWFF